MTDERLRLLVDVWKQTVEVQQHFNDIVLRIRNLALTLLLAVFGAAALALREDIRITLIGREMSLATAVLLVGLIGWVAFYFIDRFWYHKLLVGAVIHGQALEQIWSQELLGRDFLGLTGTITRESRSVTSAGKRKVCLALSVMLVVAAAAVTQSRAPVTVLALVTAALVGWFVATVLWKGDVKARTKLDFFYIIGIVVIIAIALLANGPVKVLNPTSNPPLSLQR